MQSARARLHRADAPDHPFAKGSSYGGWNSRADLTAGLDTEGGQDRYLLATLAMAAYHRRGLHLDASQIYAYAPPPIVTGSFAVDQIQVFDFVAVVNTAGQLHEQLRNRPS